MAKKLIRLTESDLHNIVKESVNKLLCELKWSTYDKASIGKFRKWRENNSIKDRNSHWNLDRAAGKAFAKDPETAEIRKLAREKVLNFFSKPFEASLEYSHDSGFYVYGQLDMGDDWYVEFEADADADVNGSTGGYICHIPGFIYPNYDDDSSAEIDNISVGELKYLVCTIPKSYTPYRTEKNWGLEFELDVDDELNKAFEKNFTPTQTSLDNALTSYLEDFDYGD